MTISIIIPLYNCGKTIDRCVESIIEYNSVNCEIILIDNGSSDETVAKCLELKEKYDNLILQLESNSGVSSARNTGLKIASGDIIGFCDADDTYEPGALDYIISFFEQNPKTDILITAYNRVEENTIVTHNIKNPGLWKNSKFKHHLIYDKNIMGSVWNKFFRVDILKDVIFDVSLTHCEDMNFVMRVLTKNKDAVIYISDTTTYNYFSNPDSVTQCVDKLFDKSGTLNYYNALQDIISKCTPDLFTYLLIKQNMFYIANDTMRFFTLNDSQKKNIKSIIRKSFFYSLLLIWKFPIQNLKRYFSTVKMLIKNK